MPIGFKDLVMGTAKKRAFNLGNNVQKSLDDIPEKYKNPSKIRRFYDNAAGKKEIEKADKLKKQVDTLATKHKEVSRATTKARLGVGLGATALAAPVALHVTGNHRKANAINNAVKRRDNEIAAFSQKRTLDTLLQDPQYPLPGKLRILEGTGQIKLGGLGAKGSVLIGSGGLGGLGVGLMSDNIDNNSTRELATSAAIGASIPAATVGLYYALSKTPAGRETLKKWRDIANAD